MVVNIIGWCIWGFLAGGAARFLLPGRVPMGCFSTIAVGVAGSLFGGFVSHLLFGNSSASFEPAGFVGAVLGGILVLLILRRTSGTD